MKKSAKFEYPTIQTKQLYKLLDYVHYDSFVRVDDFIRKWTQIPDERCTRGGLLFKRRVIRLVKAWERNIKI